jgi:hypothetical protein
VVEHLPDSIQFTPERVAFDHRTIDSESSELAVNLVIRVSSKSDTSFRDNSYSTPIFLPNLVDFTLIIDYLKVILSLLPESKFRLQREFTNRVAERQSLFLSFESGLKLVRVYLVLDKSGLQIFLGLDGNGIVSTFHIWKNSSVRLSGGRSLGSNKGRCQKLGSLFRLTVEDNQFRYL